MSILWGWINAGPFWSWQTDIDLLGRTAKSGVNIGTNNALTCTAYYAGVSLIAQTLAQVPLTLYKRLDRGKEKAREHQLYTLLHDSPNPYMCAFNFKEALQGHLLTWGNAFAEIEWERDIVKALWPLRPDQMQVAWKDGKLFYIYTLPSGQQATLTSESVLHIAGFGSDGIIGYDPITLAREALGLAKATEEFGARFFANGSQLGGVLTHPGHLTETARDNMRKSWENMHQGLTRQHRIAILEEGVSWHQTGIPPENAQFLETRKFQVTEIARFLHVPPHMIGDLEKATFSNIEHQGIEFVVYTMTPWFSRWEQTVNRKLLSMANRGEYFSEFMITGLLRGDSQSRAAYYKERFYMGSLSPNDIREKENENPVPGGDEYYVPLNMLPVGEPLPEGLVKSKGLELKRRVALQRHRITNSYKPLFRRVAQTIVDDEVRNLKKSAEELLPKKRLSQKAMNEWSAWLDKFYQDFGVKLQEIIRPTVTSLAEAIQAVAAGEVNANIGMTPELESFLVKYLASFNNRYVNSSKGQLKTLLTEAAGPPTEVIDTRLNEWHETRANKVSMNETVQLGSAVAKFVFAGAGIVRLQWVAVGSEPCPLCEEMNGRIVGIEQNFVDADATLSAEGTSQFRIDRPTSHPPLHQGCECQIVAA